ncbi:MAG: HXXEE domain-containing protein [Bacteroidales bacterium]|nr:HXXEE domain-containing protein [Bacteroidales bacterium]
MTCLAFYRRYWAAFGGLIFVVLAFVLGVTVESIPSLQRIMILLFMALLFHQFEEYIYPGGFAIANNVGLFKNRQDPARYPLNERSAVVVNVVLAYPLYVTGIFCYRCLWLDIFIAYFTMMQIIVHCFKINGTLRVWYSPGCFSAVFVMLPLGVYAIVYIATHYSVPSGYWWWPIVAFPFVAFCMVLLPIILFRSRVSPFSFPDEQAKNFTVRHGIALPWHNRGNR